MPAQAIPAPTGGLNTRDSYDQMPPEDAVQMVNWVPETGYVRSRKGNVPYANTLGGSVDTLATFHDGQNLVMFACIDDKIIDVTDPSTPVVLGSGYSSSIWNTQQFGSKLIFMNEAGDLPQIYDGDLGTITDITITTGPADPTLIDTGSSYKGRMIYSVHETDSIWYAEAGSYQGDLTEFPLGSVLTDGGNVRHVITWSRDAGSGMDDFLVIIADTGETLIYQGDDPSDALGWELVQNFKLSEPIGIKRSTVRMASRQVIITSDGYLDLEDSMKGFVSDYNAMSNKIARTVKEAVNLYAQNFGWQVVFYPEGNYLLFNVPIIEGEQFEQHVMNTRNGNWTVFEGWDSNCYVVHDKKLYFGTTAGNIFRADFGPNDSGVAIECSAIPSFNYLGNQEHKKLLTAVTIITNHPAPYAISMNGIGDFQLPRLDNLTIPVELSGEEWDVAEWDVADWSGSGNTEVNQPAKPIRRPVQAQGWAITISVRQATSQQQVYWWSQTLEYSISGVK